MKRNRRRHAALLTFALLIGLVAIPIGLTRREVRQEQLNHALIAAIEQRNTDLVRRLLHQGTDPNAVVRPEDNRPVWQCLLDVLRRGSVSATATRETALSKAIEYEPPDMAASSSLNKYATIQSLVDAGADVNGRCHTINSIPRFRTVPLVAAAAQGDWKAVQILLDHHANINATDEYGNTALMHASWRWNTDQVESLLKRGANVNAKDDNGETSLFWSCHTNERWRHEGT